MEGYRNGTPRLRKEVLHDNIRETRRFAYCHSPCVRADRKRGM
jgi:hypothetical protein